MIELNTSMVPDEKDFALHDTIIDQLGREMKTYPGLKLAVGFTTAKGLDTVTGKIGVSTTWKIEARDRRTGGKKVTARFPNLENGGTMTQLWYEMQGKSYEYWLQRTNDKLSKPKEKPVEEPPLKIKPPDWMSGNIY